MVKQYHSLLNDDFWSNIHGLGTSRRKKTQTIPVEIWENDKNLFLSIVAPGLPHLNHALKIKSRSLKRQREEYVEGMPTIALLQL
ncbi:hypothetical protein PJ311_00555 [Bacillus sp. CLL-7-23]|uniref:Uncharacterized protein n=1 Tax=Bacillus changyiensis TaxID=3004103 RepID=A0ABT4X094_9BACI|nr:hypothetical protein [Bacillus changyiensis]MDA7025094.1 hypothetical protein [Bacillus changyiensis]